MKQTATPLMPHAERMALITAPLAIRTLGCSYPWAGVLIPDTVPTSGHRVWKATPEDEEALNHKSLDD